MATIDYDALAAKHGAVPDSVDYDALAAKHGAVADASGPITAMSPTSNPVAGRMGWLAQGLPSLGGFAGGLAGIPFGPAGPPIGATIGGSLGEYGREGLTGASPNPMEIAKQGGLQGVYDVLGGLLARPLAGMAHGIMSSALKPTAPLQKRAMQTMARTVGRAVTPEEASIAKLALSERVGATQGGLKKVRGAIGDASDKLDQLLGDAGATGQTFNVKDALTHVQTLKGAVGRQSDAIPALNSLESKIRNLVAAQREPGAPARGASMLLNASGQPARAAAPATRGPLKQLSPLEFNELKRTWQNAADAIYKAQESGAVIGPKQALSARFNADIASSARKSLERIPGVAEQNQRMATLRPLENAVLASRMRHTGMTLPWVPHAANLVIPSAMRSPAMQSRLALLLNDPMFGQMVRNSPRLAAMLFFPPGGAPPDQTQAPPAQGGRQ